jgi:hypothetical protein
VVELDTQLFFKETYETRDRLVERYGLRLERPEVITVARQAIEEGFILDVLTNWYIRRSRRRFWEEDDVALRTLWWAVVQGLQVIAPIVPFLTEHLWANLVVRACPGAPDSVFLARWPELGDPVLSQCDVNALAFVFAWALEANGSVLALRVEGGADLTRKQLDALTEQAKARGAKGLAWVAVEEQGLRSPLDKFFSDAERDGLRQATGAQPGDLLLLAADRTPVAQTVLGDLRARLAAERGLVPEGRWAFLWVTEFPMFDGTGDDGSPQAAHHRRRSPAVITSRSLPGAGLAGSLPRERRRGVPPAVRRQRHAGGQGRSLHRGAGHAGGARRRAQLVPGRGDRGRRGTWSDHRAHALRAVFTNRKKIRLELLAYLSYVRRAIAAGNLSAVP